MSNRLLEVSVLCAVLCVGDVAVAAAQSANEGQPPARTGASPVLAGLVRDAVTRNLTIDVARPTPAIAEADIQAARGVFDPRIEVLPVIGRSSQSLVTENESFDSNIGLAGLGGTAVGLVPSSGLGVAGRLRTGAQYGVSLDSTRRSMSRRAGTFPTQYDTTMTLSLAQPLLRGAGSTIARAEIRSATIGAAASRATFTRVVETTVAEVENAYWLAVYARALERVVEESLVRARTLLQRNQQLLALTLVASIDVLTARQSVAVRMAALTQARQQRADATDAIIFLVYGREAASHLADGFELETAVLPDVAQLDPGTGDVVAEALRLRSDLAEARLRREQSGVGVAIAQDALRPRLDLTGSYTALTANVAAPRPFGADRAGDIASAGWQGGLYFSVPIGNNAAKAEVQQATLVAVQQATAVAAVENQVQLEVRQAQRAIRMGGERVRQTTEALQIALDEYNAENERLQLGLSDSFRVLQFEELINEAQQAQLLARYDLALAGVAFNLARGASAATYGVAP